MKTRIRHRLAANAFAVAILAAGAAAAESPRAPLPAAYVEECGSCHVAFPGRMLDAPSWSAVIGGLEQHFGVDASVDPKTLEPIRAYLASSARSHPTTTGGAPSLRITETRWFRHEHADIAAATWSAPKVRSAANCSACHGGAESGDYSERSVRVPR